MCSQEELSSLTISNRRDESPSCCLYSKLSGDNLIGEEAYPQNDHAQTANQGKEGNCARLTNISCRRFERVKDNQRKPDNGQSRRPTQLRRFCTRFVEKIIEKDNQETN